MSTSEVLSTSPYVRAAQVRPLKTEKTLLQWHVQEAARDRRRPQKCVEKDPIYRVCVCVCVWVSARKETNKYLRPRHFLVRTPGDRGEILLFRHQRRCTLTIVVRLFCFHMYACTNAQMHKCTNAQMHTHAHNFQGARTHKQASANRILPSSLYATRYKHRIR